METKTGWEGTADKILELHRQGPGAAPAAREAVAGLQTEGERLIGLLHDAGPGKVAPKCIACLGKTTACECEDDPECQFSTGNTVRRINAALHALLDKEWAAAHQGPNHRIL